MKKQYTEKDFVLLDKPVKSSSGVWFVHYINFCYSELSFYLERNYPD